MMDGLVERLRKNCPPASESEYVRRLESDIERLNGRLEDMVAGLPEESARLWHRLVAERDQLQVENAELRSVVAGLQVEFAVLQAENERLQELLRGVGANRYWEGRWRDEVAENARLRAALKGIEVYAASKDDAKGIAAKALLGAPVQTPQFTAYGPMDDTA